MIAPALAVLLGSCLLVRGLLLLARKRRGPAPASTIDGVPQGQVEIHGASTGPYSITAPITGKACYLYRTTVWQQKRSTTHAWEKLADETLHVPFFLDDSTSRMLIEPLGAELEIPISLREEYGGSVFFDAREIPPAVSVFLARHRVIPTNRILIEEFCVEPQSELFVTGTVTENPGVEVKPLVPRKTNGLPPNGTKNGQPRADAPEVIHLSGASAPLPSGSMTQQSRIAAALAKAGIDNPNAWAAAGVPYPGPAAATALLHEEADSPPDQASPEKPELQSGFHLKPPLVLMKGAGDAPFVLSARSTRQPAQPSPWTPAILLSTGAALTLAGFWTLLAKMHLL